MRKGIMSLEDLDQPVEVLGENELELANAETETEASELANETDQVAETESIADSVNMLTEQVEAKVEDGEGISEETARTLEVAVEHFKTRLGYSKKMIPAMEGFKAETSRLHATKVTLENLKVLQAGLNKQLVISQEGLGARFVNAVKRAFTNNDKIRSSLAKLKDKKAIETKTFEDPAWGRVFALSGKKELSGSDIAKHLSAISKFRPTLVPMIKELTEIVRKAANEVDKSLFIAKDEATAELNKLSEQSVAIKAKYEKEFTINFNKEGVVNIKSATDAEIKNISSTVLDLINDSEYIKAVGDLDEALDKATIKLWSNTQYRVASQFAADIRAFHRLMEDSVRSMYSTIAYTSNIDWKACYSAYKYLEASAVK